MDFIVGLPPSMYRGNVYDSILVVVDRHSKMVRLVPCSHTINAEQLGTLLIDEVFLKYRIPASIVSDRGTQFTSAYWAALCYYLQVKRKLSTSYRPQTDGQIERLNQELECYLRCYMNDEQSDWASLLSSAEWAINNTVNSTTGRTPFDLVYIFTPTTRRNLSEAQSSLESSRRPALMHTGAAERAKQITTMRKQLQESWAKTQERVKKYYDNRHRPVLYRVGQYVLLSTKNIKLRKAMKKLSDKFIGPFKVIEKHGDNACRLQMPKKYSRLYPSFHVSLLQPYYKRDGVQPKETVDLDEDDGIYEVEAIRKAQGKGSNRRWLVKWTGYREDENTWEPKEHLQGAWEMVEQFEKTL